MLLSTAWVCHVKVFWVGDPKKNFPSELLSIKPVNLVLSHFGWVDGPKKKILVWSCMEPNLVLSHFSFLRTWVLFLGHWYLFWTSDDICPGFWSQGGSLTCIAYLPAHNKCLRFTSSVTPTNLLAASISSQRHSLHVSSRGRILRFDRETSRIVSRRAIHSATTTALWCYLTLGGWAGGWFQEKNLVWICIKPNLVLSYFGWIDGWYREKLFGPNLYHAKSGAIAFPVGKGGGKSQPSKHHQRTNTIVTR